MQIVDVLKFKTFVEINTRINSNFQDINALLTEIMDSAARLCDAEASSLLLVDKETGFLYFEVALGPKGSDVKRFVVKSGEGIAGWVFERNEAIILSDAESDKRHLFAISRDIGYPCETMIAVPMRIKEKCIGVLEIINKKGGRLFTESDMEWLEVFANQAALAIANTQSMEQAHGEIQRLQVELTDKQEREQGYHTLIAKSPIILEKLAIVERIAQTDSSALILGESGVGKELFAEQIHLCSPRRNAPFIRVNCAALPENLLESELFGYVKGAFTGAASNRKGRFELADGGTIFLDEIGELPLSVQAKLLRVLQQKAFERVGEATPVTVNLRILAATNRDLEAMVEKGEFRNDLYYRLNVLPLYVPPLRQRTEDIPELAQFFLKKYSLEMKKQFDGFSEDALQAMLTYSWPGNIRELQNCIERACVLGRHKRIGEGDLFFKKTDFVEKEESRDLKTAIDSFKAQFIKKALEENKWNQTATAKVLDIQRTYLSKLIKDLEIEPVQAEHGARAGRRRSGESVSVRRIYGR
ncbi:MAG: sigma 54-interacting transcriptional regulator [Treponema sp.]|jgi:Nif-specific regulatory protein|nr:sigma 54-interacting transcriptional regulator [Treponema sp.]